MTRYDQIYRELSELLRPFAGKGQVVSPASLLVEELGVDSVQAMEFLMDLEDRLDTTIPMNILPEVRTVDDLVRAIERAMA
jgi:acyl carrier protein